MQPLEFMQMLEGYQWRQQNMEVMAAYFVSYLLNVSGKSLKNTITPMDLIKPLRTPQKTRTSRKEDEQYLINLFNLQKGGE